MDEIIFSVIVVSLNEEATILDTLNSILTQSINEYEIIVKDGCSKDNTLKLIPDNRKIIIVSKPDRSVYEAMNQALYYAHGKYVIYMNCGDTFYDSHVLESVYSVVKENKLNGNEVIYGNYYNGGKLYKQTENVNREYIVNAGLCHQTVFFGRRLFEKYGGFDTKLKICADYEIMTRVFCKGVPYIYINKVICNYLGGGISERKENLKLVKHEGDLVRKRYFSFVDRLKYTVNRGKNRILRKRNSYGWNKK